MAKAKKSKKDSPKKKLRKFIVSIAVDCRVDKEVEAESFEEAFQIANDYGIGLDEWSRAEVIDDRPVNAYDVENDELRDY